MRGLVKEGVSYRMTRTVLKNYFAVSQMAAISWSAVVNGAKRAHGCPLSSLGGSSMLPPAAGFLGCVTLGYLQSSN